MKPQCHEGSSSGRFVTGRELLLLPELLLTTGSLGGDPGEGVTPFSLIRLGIPRLQSTADVGVKEERVWESF